MRKTRRTRPPSYGRVSDVVKPLKALPHPFPEKLRGLPLDPISDADHRGADNRNFRIFPKISGSATKLLDPLSSPL